MLIKRIRGVWKMLRNGWLLFIVLLLIAVLVSCGKKKDLNVENGELIKIESEWKVGEKIT